MADTWEDLAGLTPASDEDHKKKRKKAAKPPAKEALGSSLEDLAFGGGGDDSGLSGIGVKTTEEAVGRATGPSRYIEGGARGLLGSAGSLLSGYQYLESLVGIDTPVGRAAGAGAKAIEEKVNQSLDRVPDQGFADRLAEGIGSMALFLIPGVGTAVGATRLALVAPRLARWLGTGTMTVMESFAEAGESYKALLNSGMDEDAATKKASGVLAQNLVLLAVTNKLGLFAEKGSRAWHTAKSAVMEGVQEGFQADIGQRAQGQDRDWWQILEAAAVGFLIGGGAGAVIGQGVGGPPQPAAPAVPVAPALTPVEQRAAEASTRGEAAVSKIEDLAAKPEVPREPLPGQGTEAGAEITPTTPSLTPLVTKAQAAAEAAGVDLPDAELLNAARTAAVEASGVADKAKLAEDIEAVLKKQPGVTPEIAAELAPKIAEAVKDDPAVGSRQRPERAPGPAAGPRTGEPFEAPVYRGAKGEYFARPAEGKKPGRTALVRLQTPYVVELPERGVAFEGLRQQFGTEDPVAIATTLRERGYDGLVLSYPGGDFAVFTATPPVETRGAAGRPKPEPRGAAAQQPAQVAEGGVAASQPAPAAGTPGAPPELSAFRGSEDLSWAPNPETGQPRRILDLTGEGALDSSEAVAAALSRRLGVDISADADIAAALGAAGYDVVKYRAPGQRSGQVTWVGVQPGGQPSEADAAARRVIDDLRSRPGLDPARVARLDAIKQELETRRSLRSEAAPRFQFEHTPEFKEYIGRVAAALPKFQESFGKPDMTATEALSQFIEIGPEAHAEFMAALDKESASTLEKLQATVATDQAGRDFLQAKAERLRAVKSSMHSATIAGQVIYGVPLREYLFIESLRHKSLYEDAVKRATRTLGGERTREQAAAEAGKLAEGLTLAKIQAIYPGTTLNDSEILAVGQVLTRLGGALKEAADRVIKSDYKDGVALMDFASTLALFHNIAPKVEGAKLEAERVHRLFDEVTEKSHFAMLNQIEDVLGNFTTGMDVKALVRRVAKLEPTQVAAMSRSISKGDALVGAWVNGLLSGPQTHVVNLLSNTAFGLWMVPERLAASATGRVRRAVTGGSRRAAQEGRLGVVPGEARELVHGAVQALVRVDQAYNMFHEAAKAWREYHSTEIDPAEKTELKPRHEGGRKVVSLTAAYPGNWLASTADVLTLGVSHGWPGRLLVTSDAMLKAVSRRGQRRALALREAYEDILVDSEATVRGRLVVTRSTELIQKFHRYLNDPTDTMEKQAQEFADYTTFTSKLGPLGRKIQDVRDSHPWMRVLLPFLQTPTNLFKRGVERTPFLQFVSPTTRRNLTSPDRALRDTATGVVGFSFAASGYVAYLAVQGLLTGAGPREPELRKQWEAAGWKEYSFDWGLASGQREPGAPPRPGDLISFGRIDPISMWAGSIVDLVNASGWLPDGEYTKFWGELMANAHGNFASKTWVHGVVDMVLAFTDPERRSAGAVSQLISSIVPNAHKQLGRAMLDNQYRMYSDWGERLFAKVPGLSNTLEPDLDLFGNPRFLGGGWGRYSVGPEFVWDAVSPFYLNTSAPKAQQKILWALRENDIRTPEPPKTVKGVELDSTQRANVIKLAAGQDVVIDGKPVPGVTIGGKTLQQGLETMMRDDVPQWHDAEPGRDGYRATIIHRLVGQYHTEARERLYHHDPVLKQKVHDVITEKAESAGATPEQVLEMRRRQLPTIGR